MLRWRLIWAAAIIAPLALLMLVDHQLAGRASPGAWLLPLAVLIACMAAGEVLDLLQSQPWRPAAWTVYGGTLLIVLASGAPVILRCLGAERVAVAPPQLGLPMAALALGLLLAFIGEMLRYERPGGVMARVALAVLAMTYVGLLMSFLMALRLYGGNDVGMAALLSLILVVKFSDTGAYACGRLVGRRKMAPLLSPGKTIEGAVGGLLAGCLASWAAFRVLLPLIVEPTEFTVSRWGWLWYGLVVTLFGMVGDLAESMFKRDMGRKDSSGWLPGLGGVLDVLDSVLAAAPAAYVFWVAEFVGSTKG